MGIVRGTSPLARLGARLRRGTGGTSQTVSLKTRRTYPGLEGGGALPRHPIFRGDGRSPDAPPIVPARNAPTEIAQPPAEPGYPRHGFGQEWPR